MTLQTKNSSFPTRSDRFHLEPVHRLILQQTVLVLQQNEGRWHLGLTITQPLVQLLFVSAFPAPAPMAACAHVHVHLVLLTQTWAEFKPATCSGPWLQTEPRTRPSETLNQAACLGSSPNAQQASLGLSSLSYERRITCSGLFHSIARDQPRSHMWKFFSFRQ